MPRIYLDHNATSPLRPEALAAMRAVLEGPAGNPSSLHKEGRAARAVVEDARSKVAALVGASPKEIVFTSGGSEAIAAAVHGILERASPLKRKIVVSAIEHSAVLEAARRFEVVEIACDRDGQVPAERMIGAIDERTALVALQAANNETGVVQAWEEVARVCDETGVPLLLDAVQAAGKVRLAALPSLVALSAHKLGGPQGTGALVVRDGTRMVPLIAGGAQERRRRGGTEAVAVIAGFGAAAEVARPGDESLRTRVESFLDATFPEVVIHGRSAPRLPNTINFAIPGVPGETLAIALDVAGFAVSTGSACASGAVEPSHVIRAMGYSQEESRRAVRVSLGWSTTLEEIERFLAILPEVVARVRASVVPSGP